MLIKLSSGDIGLDKPIDFAVYSIDGKLLLQKGHVIDSEGLLERLYRLGHREGPAVAARGGARHTSKSSTSHAGTDERNQLLFGTAQVPDTHAPISPFLNNKNPSLPNLGQKVEFFHLVPEGGNEPLRVDLTGVIAQEALIVRCMNDGAAVLQPNITYEARLFTGSKMFKFTTRMLPEAGPFGCYFLEYPESVAQAGVRKHHRVATSFVGKLHSGEYQRAVAEVTVENVSSTGAGVSTAEDLLTVGQNARLAMNLSIDSRSRPVVVYVEVRNRRQIGDRFTYGLEFVRMTDEIRRDIKDFVLDSVASV